MTLRFPKAGAKAPQRCVKYKANSHDPDFPFTVIRQVSGVQGRLKGGWVLEVLVGRRGILQ